MKMKNYVAFFDLDRTILDTSSGTVFAKYCYRKRIISLADMIAATFILLIHKMGFLNTEFLVRRSIKRFKGWSGSELKKLTQEWFDMELVQHIREKAASEIKRHNDNNGMTIILSAATQYGCEVVRNYLKMDGILCTIIEIKDDVFTGEIDGTYCYNEGKLDQAVRFCSEKGFSMEDAYYYADARADIPVLEKVGHPVCVTPDRRLAARARKMNWMVENW
jgi:HAD superfamily hydrolase (TIGR01490 family)